MGLTVSLSTQLRAAGLPVPVEDGFCHNPSRRWRWDYAWPDEPYRLLVDVQGGIWTGGKHVRGKGLTNDIEKHNDAILAGFRVLWLTPQQIANGFALETIRRALEGG